MPIIEIKGLYKTFGQGNNAFAALNGIDLSIEEGEIFGVVGRSGAGKSTFIRCLNLLERPSRGQVLVGGLDFSSLGNRGLREARRRMGMIFQSFNLLSSRTVAGNVAFPMQIAGLPASEVKGRVEELLDLVGLSDKAKAYPAQLSGGQKQRVGIARALANNPSILLCDEATSALDPQTTESILSLLEDVKNRLGLTVVLITHEMNVITRICDRVAVMEAGRIVEMGSVIEVFARPQHPASKSFAEVIHQRSRFLETEYRPKGLLLRLGFIGQSVGDPLVSSLVRNFSLEPNILQAHVDRIKDTAYGSLLLDLSGNPEDIEAGLDFLRSLDITLEVLS